MVLSWFLGPIATMNQVAASYRATRLASAARLASWEGLQGCTAVRLQAANLDAVNLEAVKIFFTAVE